MLRSYVSVILSGLPDIPEAKIEKANFLGALRLGRRNVRPGHFAGQSVHFARFQLRSSKLK
jgi:hypothetical protein